MNLPNMTLFVQMMHFAIAYWFMRRFIFEPALEIIESKEAYQKNLEQKISMTQRLQQESIKRQYAGWKLIKDSLYHLIPKCMVSTISKSTIVDQNSIEKIKLSSERKQEVIDLLHRELLDVKS